MSDKGEGMSNAERVIDGLDLCLSRNYYGYNCQNCVYQNKDGDCQQDLFKDALALIEVSAAEAIPVSWVREYIRDLKAGGDRHGAMEISLMLAEWRDENGRVRSGDARFAQDVQV